MLDRIRIFLFDNPAFGIRLFETIVILFVLLVVRRLIMWLVNDRLEDSEQIYSWRKWTEYIFLFVGLIIVVTLWFEGFDNASTYLGLLSAGIAIALQDPLINLVGWLFIIFRHPFVVGDRIEVGGVAGDVIDVHLLKFTVLEIGNWVDAEQSTGRVVHIPNRQVFRHPVANYTGGVPFIWNEIPITVTFESDWQIGKRVLQEIAERHSLRPNKEEEAEIRKAAKRINAKYRELSPVVYTKVSESGVVLTLRYVCRPRYRRTSEQKIWEEILLLFAEQEEVDFAYHTQRVFYHPIEGKTLMADHSEVAHPRNHLIDDINRSSR